MRADPNDGISAGTQWFELFYRLRTLPIADRPTLYNIQGNLIAAVYAVGLGKISKAASLLSEAITMCIDAGLHRSADTYDVFDPIEDEVRKRTFWCVYIWDKQLSAHFGRPSMIRLRDCDVAEPAPVDDEFITRDGVGVPPPGTECRLTAFICSLRIMVVLEAVLDVPPARQPGDPSSFLLRATSVLSGSRRFKELKEEEALLDDVHRSIPAYWAHTPETLATDDTIRLTQAERLYCAEQFVRLLIHRHRFSELVAERTSSNGDEEPNEMEKEALIAAHTAALQIVAAHLHIAKKGLMTYCEPPPLTSRDWCLKIILRLVRWCTRDTPVDSGWKNIGRNSIELQNRSTSAPNPPGAGRPQVLRRFTPKIQWSLCLRSAIRGSDGRILST